MSDVSYSLTKRLPDTDFDTAAASVRAALAEEGFGILTEIDVQTVLKAKIDVDFRRYTIFGACNPQLAHQALVAEPLIGLLLPCNVVVAEEDEGGTIVAFASPRSMFSVVDHPGLEPLVADVEGRLTRALAAVG